MISYEEAKEISSHPTPKISKENKAEKFAEIISLFNKDVKYEVQWSNFSGEVDVSYTYREKVKKEDVPELNKILKRYGWELVPYKMGIGNTKRQMAKLIPKKKVN